MKPGKYVVFALDQERYGLPIETVEQILHAQYVTRMPGSAPNVIGVFDLRGTTIPVVDTRMVLGLGPKDAACFVVANVEGQRFAITVDSVDRIANYEDTQLEQSQDDNWVAKEAENLTVLVEPSSLCPAA